MSFMLNNIKVEQLKNEFQLATSEKLIADNNSAAFSVFLYLKIIEGMNEVIDNAAKENPSQKEYLDRFKKNLNHKLGTSF
jgi:hypothetical protein